MWTSLRTGGGITGSLRFTHESTAPDRCYFEWELEALGQRVQGITILTLDSSGLIDNVALHHRPLGAVLAFSAEIGAARELSRPGCLLPGPGQPAAEPAQSRILVSAQTGIPSWLRIVSQKRRRGETAPGCPPSSPRT